MNFDTMLITNRMPTNWATAAQLTQTPTKSNWFSFLLGVRVSEILTVVRQLSHFLCKLLLSGVITFRLCYFYNFKIQYHATFWFTIICFPLRLSGGSPTWLPSHSSASSPNNVRLHAWELSSLPHRKSSGRVHSAGDLFGNLLFPNWCSLLYFADWETL